MEQHYFTPSSKVNSRVNLSDIRSNDTKRRDAAYNSFMSIIASVLASMNAKSNSMLIKSCLETPEDVLCHLFAEKNISEALKSIQKNPQGYIFQTAKRALISEVRGKERRLFVEATRSLDAQYSKDDKRSLSDKVGDNSFNDALYMLDENENNSSLFNECECVTDCSSSEIAAKKEMERKYKIMYASIAKLDERERKVIKRDLKATEKKTKEENVRKKDVNKELAMELNTTVDNVYLIRNRAINNLRNMVRVRQKSTSVTS